jgi:hypothetical protein
MRAYQTRGWLHPGVDPVAFAAWISGLTLGRSLIELSPGDVDGAAWNEMSIAAVLAIASGEYLS